MDRQEKSGQSAAAKGDKAAKKSARDERLKKSLRANLQRRKAKMRALRSAEQSDSDD